MMKKVYIDNLKDFLNASINKEKVFIEYRNKEEEIENSSSFCEESWLFTLKVIKNASEGQEVRFFKVVI